MKHEHYNIGDLIIYQNDELMLETPGLILNVINYNHSIYYKIKWFHNKEITEISYPTKSFLNDYCIKLS